MWFGTGRVALVAGLEIHLGRGWCPSETGLVKFENKNDANGYYRALGLSPNASKAEIKAAYRRLAKKLHPDVGGDEELFKFVSGIVEVLLDDEAKVAYDAVGEDAMYLGYMEREELARSGMLSSIDEMAASRPKPAAHWACLTNSGFSPDAVTDRWIELCREVSLAVGYRGKIRVGVIEGGRQWLCDPVLPWGILSVDSESHFVVFQRGAEPNRLHALCAMIDWKKHLLDQIRQKWAGFGPRQKENK